MILKWFGIGNKTRPDWGGKTADEIYQEWLSTGEGQGANDREKAAKLERLNKLAKGD